MSPRVLVSLAAIAALSAVAPSAIAQTRARTDAAQASVLFEEGRRALAAKDEARACAAFRESLALDVTVGTLLNVAQCEDRRGELAQAHAHLRQAVDRAREQNDRRLAYLEAQLATLDARAPQLTVTLAAPAPSGTTVRRDGIPLAGVALGLAVPVDVGHHVIEVAAGDAVKRYEVDMAPGQRLTVEVTPPPPSATVASPPPAVPLSPPSSAEPGATTGTTTRTTWSSRRTAAVVVAGAGGVGLVIGAIFGARALSDRTDAHAVMGCSPSGVCSSTALGAWNMAHDSWSHDASVSTLALALGGAAVVAGALVWMTAPSSDSRPPTAAWSVGLTPSRLEVTGRF